MDSSQNEPSLEYVMTPMRLSLCTYKWENIENPLKPRGAILLFHGITAHIPYEFLVSGGQTEAEHQWLSAFKTSGASDQMNSTEHLSSSSSSHGKRDELYQKSGIRHLYFKPTAELDIESEEYPHLDTFYKRHSNIPASLCDLVGKQEPPSDQLDYQRSWVEMMQKDNYLVYGIDVLGHGKSDAYNGHQCAIHSFDAVTYDASRYIATVQQHLATKWHGETIPLFLMGISFGGALVARVLQLCDEATPHNIAGAILLAPALSLTSVSSSGINKYLSFLPKIFSTIAPYVRAIPPIKNPKFEYVNEVFQRDPLTYKKSLHIRSCAELLMAATTIQKDIQNIESCIPLLICHSIYDTLCDPSGSQEFFQATPNVDKQLWLIHGLWHMLTKEPGGYQLCEHILQWCNVRAPPKQ